MLNLNTGEYERKKYANLNRLYNAPNLNNFPMSKRLEWAGQVWRTEAGLIRQLVPINKRNEKRSVGRPRQRWMDRAKDSSKRLRNGARIKDAKDRGGWKIFG